MGSWAKQGEDSVAAILTCRSSTFHTTMVIAAQTRGYEETCAEQQESEPLLPGQSCRARDHRPEDQRIRDQQRIVARPIRLALS